MLIVQELCAYIVQYDTRRLDIFLGIASCCLRDYIMSSTIRVRRSSNSVFKSKEKAWVCALGYYFRHNINLCLSLP